MHVEPGARMCSRSSASPAPASVNGISPGSAEAFAVDPVGTCTQPAASTRTTAPRTIFMPSCTATDVPGGAAAVSSGAMASRPASAALSYTVRRDEPTRIEGFSDAVFGFTLALLAFSLDVPSSIEQLRALVVAQLVPTLAAFALMCWIWAEHNSFFRQFGLQDSTTIVLNCALLFLVVFYAYPLKFMAVFLWGLIASGFGWTGILSALGSSGSLNFGGADSTGGIALMAIYNTGFITLFAIFAALYSHALKQKDVLALDEIELFEARAGRRVHLISVAIGLLSMAVLAVLALAAPALAGLAGLVYMVMGPAHGIHGARYAKARATLMAEREAAASSDVTTAGL